MAKKVYMKFSDERNLQNSIKTIIQDVGDRRIVVKQPVFKESAKHIRGMHDKVGLLKISFPDIKLNNAEISGDSLQFSYIYGECLSEYYRQCIVNRSRDDLFRLISKHKEIIRGAEDNQCIFYETDESRKLFGDLSQFEGEKALKVTNFEATANNIYISGEDIYFIDYEWIFDFPIPLDLVFYHCIVWTGFANIPQLSNVITMDELIKYLQVDVALCENHINFINYITDNSAYYLSKKGYEKGKYSIYEIDRIWSAKQEQQQNYINQLEEGQKNQQEYIGNLEKDLKSQNEYIQEIEDLKCSQQEYIGNLEKDLKSQNEYIREIEELKCNQQEYIDNLEKDLKSQNKYIQEIEEIKCSQQEYIEKEENEIAALKSQIDELNMNIANLDCVSETQKADILNLEETLAIQNQYVNNLESKIEKYIDEQKNKGEK